VRRLAFTAALILAVIPVSLCFAAMGFAVAGFGVIRTAFELWGHDGKEG
jgi:hypothetical protein